jgi:hypothetical protein
MEFLDDVLISTEVETPDYLWPTKNWKLFGWPLIPFRQESPDLMLFPA